MPGYNSYKKKRGGYSKPKATRQQKNRGTNALIPKTFGSALSMARRALSLGTMLKGMINCEKKYHDVSQTPEVISYNGDVTLLSGMSAGDDVGNRDGNSILARSLHFRADITGNTTNTSNVTRCIIFIDKMNQGSAPGVSDILAVTGSSNAVNSPLNVDHITRYSIILDKIWTTSVAGTQRHVFKKYINLYKHIKFTGTGNTDVYQNAIYVLWVTDVITNDPVVTWYSRLGFYDN